MAHFSLFLSLLLSNSNLKIVRKNNISVNLCMPYHWGSVGHRVFQYLFETIMGCLIPFSLISTCYSSVICRLQSVKFQRRGQGSRLILLIIIAFVIFWLPYHVVNIVEVIVLISTRQIFADCDSSAGSQEIYDVEKYVLLAKYFWEFSYFRFSGESMNRIHITVRTSTLDNGHHSYCISEKKKIQKKKFCWLIHPLKKKILLIQSYAFQAFLFLILDF